ncbi:uncharacterized protein DDB_G0287625 isoform X2 [Aphidius gifuensis]|uniref:uncharacterized protein DDB_G0287625 isoform X2 n=1 Tax=Aphidius gifuensis TaxID=684658 RepID=UPI001CDBCA89|nr:uncharacterized protein DDB_G0287625 isoform X2 [Aphidius gifuensis]
MTTTMDTDSESQDSDDGRRFRFETTRKDATTAALQARKRNVGSSPPPRDNLRRSRSRDRPRYERKDDNRRQDYRGNNYDDNNRRNQKEQRNRDDDQRKKDDNYRYRDNKNYSSSKDPRESTNSRDSRELLNRDSRESTNRDSRSRDLRESKNSRDDNKRKRSRERNRDLKNRDKYRRYSRERERSNRDSIRQDEQQQKSIKETNTEELTSDNINIKTTAKTSRGEFKEQINSEETDKVINSPPQNGDHVNDIDDDDVDDDDNDDNDNHDDEKSPNLDNSNNHDISDFLLASTSAKSSCSYNDDDDNDNNDNHDDNNRLINNKNKNCTEVIKKLDISKNNNDDDADEDSYGPILPPSINEKVPEKKIIGPCLPECFKKQIEENIIKNENDDDDEEEEDTFGPALPPHLASKNCQVLEQELAVKMDISDSVKDVKNCEDNDDDDDGCIGPLPANHPALQDDLVQQQLEYRARMIKRELAEIDNNVDEKKREEWMTELPSIQTAHLGLVPRSFRSKPGPDMSDRSSWTDTPVDRAKKQREKLLMIGNGSKDKAPNEPEIMEKPSKRKEKSLMEMHQKKLHKKKKKEEKEAKEAGLSIRRPFDRDIDMQVNRFDEARNKTILRKAASLDDRFARGKI